MAYNFGEKLVSIIVPIYNSEKYLKKCLGSICKQTYKNYEVLLIDDGSTDSSEIICKNYIKEDKRFSYYKKNQGGVSSARNMGILKSKGKYITFIDSDDFISEVHISTLASKMESYDMSIVGYSKLDNKNQLSVHTLLDMEVEKDKLVNIILLDSNVTGSPCNKMYKKEIIDKYQILFNENIKTGEDLVFNIEYSLKSNLAYVSDLSTYFYYKHPEGVTGKVNSVEKLEARLTDLDALRICLFILPDNYETEIKYLIKRIAISGSYCYRLSLDVKLNSVEKNKLKKRIDYYIKRYLFDKSYNNKKELYDKTRVIINRYTIILAKTVYFLKEK